MRLPLDLVPASTPAEVSAQMAQSQLPGRLLSAEGVTWAWQCRQVCPQAGMDVGLAVCGRGQRPLTGCSCCHILAPNSEESRTELSKSFWYQFVNGGQNISYFLVCHPDLQLLVIYIDDQQALICILAPGPKKKQVCPRDSPARVLLFRALFQLKQGMNHYARSGWAWDIWPCAH